MRNAFKLVFLILIVILSSCDKKESEISVSKTGLIYQVYFGSDITYEYTYNDKNLIVEEKSRWHFTNHSYKDGKLTYSDYYVDPGIYSSSSYLSDSAMNRTEWVNPDNTEKEQTTTYYYDKNDRIIKSSNYLNICEYSFDDRARIIRQSFYRDNEITGYIDFSYDNRDNLIKRMHYWIMESGIAELQSTTEFALDDKQNPYKGFMSLMMPGKYSNTNNIVKETYTIHFEVGPGIEKVQVIVNEYKYNRHGYPVSKNSTETYKYY